MILTQKVLHLCLPPTCAAFSPPHTCFLAHGFCSFSVSFGLCWRDPDPISIDTLGSGSDKWPSPSLFHFQISREGSDWLSSAQRTALDPTIVWELKGLRAGCRLQIWLLWTAWAGSNCLRGERRVEAGASSYVTAAPMIKISWAFFISHSSCALLPFIPHVFLFLSFSWPWPLLSPHLPSAVSTLAWYSRFSLGWRGYDGIWSQSREPTASIPPHAPTLHLPNHSGHLLAHWKTLVSKTHTDIVLYSHLSNQSLLCKSLSQHNLLPWSIWYSHNIINQHSPWGQVKP